VSKQKQVQSQLQNQNPQNNHQNKLKGFKENLPIKICIACNRPFQYRKKWKECWDDVKYCSNKCKNLKK
jgi:hypothetical protein